MSSTHRNDRLAATPLERGNLIAAVVSAVLVVAVATAGSVLVWSMRHELPETVVTHWGIDGRPDGFSQLSGIYLTNAVLITAVGLSLVILGAVLRQARLLGPIGVASAVFMALMMDVGLLAQRGLAADEVPEAGIGLQILVAMVVATLVGIGLGVVLRRPQRRGGRAVEVNVGDGEPRLLVDVGVTVAWTGRTAVPATVWVLLGLSAAITLVPATMAALAGSWEMALTMVVLAALTLGIGATMIADITVDVRGVRVRGLGFIPWLTVPLEEIAGASVTGRVNPLCDFGGWGLRVNADGEKGFVTASGPAVRIDRGTEPAVVITMTDAEAAAATINTLVARRPAG